jgi:outer membrane protein OmpA-like peptidoglycan-associated protein
MKKLLIALVLFATANFSTACVATRKFTRKEVKTSADTLNARIDTTNGEVKETRDSVDRVNQRVTTVDGRVTDLDSKTTAGLNTLKSDVQTVDQKAVSATQKASDAQTAANRTAGDLTVLDKNFQNRNQFTVAAEKTVQFKFNSAVLDASNNENLNEIAETAMRNPDAIVVLEGRTDSMGDKDYNVKLGERRIEAVRRYLAVEKGVPVYKIHEISFGADKPIAPNDSRDGREKNRAVTMSILVPRTMTAQGGQ